MKVIAKALIISSGLTLASAYSMSANAQRLEDVANPPCGPTTCGKAKNETELKKQSNESGRKQKLVLECDFLCVILKKL